jgi:DNA (cytosine-5)-methyltransferase 1
MQPPPPRPLLPLPRPIAVDLFCGAGGLSLGFEMAGYRVGLGIEKDELARRTHHHNFGGRGHQGDIRDIAEPASFVREQGLAAVDVIIGGLPCQGFSRVGRGKMRNLRNDPTYIHDPRNR